MRVEDGELVALVLEEPRLGIDVELEAIRGFRGIAAGNVALGDAVAKRHETARLVRSLGLGMVGELPA